MQNDGDKNKLLDNYSQETIKYHILSVHVRCTLIFIMYNNLFVG